MPKKDMGSATANILKQSSAKIKEQNNSNLKELAITDIEENENNFFNMESDSEYRALVESVRQRGVMHPIVVFQLPDGKYKLISGHRRYRASVETKKETIPSIVLTFEDDSDKALAMVDANLTARNLKSFEIAKAIEVLEEITKSDTNYSSGKKRDYIGSLLGLSGIQVQRYKSLNNLIPEIKELVENEEIGMSSATEFASLPKENQEKVLNKINEAKAKDEKITRDKAKEIKNEVISKAIPKNKKQDIPATITKVDNADTVLEGQLTLNVTKIEEFDNLQAFYNKEITDMLFFGILGKSIGIDSYGVEYARNYLKLIDHIETTFTFNPPERLSGLKNDINKTIDKLLFKEANPKPTAKKTKKQ